MLEIHYDVERFIGPELLWQPTLDPGNDTLLLTTKQGLTRRGCFDRSTLLESIYIYIDIFIYVNRSIYNDINIRLDHPCCMGLADAIIQAVSKCDSGLQTELLEHVICTGGVCSLPGFKMRLTKELQTQWPQAQMHVNIVPHEQYASYAGACKYSMGLRDNLWITPEEYDSQGVGIVHAKCF